MNAKVFEGLPVSHETLVFFDEPQLLHTDIGGNKFVSFAIPDLDEAAAHESFIIFPLHGRNVSEFFKSDVSFQQLVDENDGYFYYTSDSFKSIYKTPVLMIREKEKYLLEQGGKYFADTMDWEKDEIVVETRF